MADDAAIAAKYGGTPVDHAAIAAKYGGKPLQAGVDSLTRQTNLAAAKGGESLRATMPVLPQVEGTPYGFDPSHMLLQAGQGIKELGTGLYGMVRHPINTVEGDIQARRALREKGENAPDALSGFGYGMAGTLPLIGPWAAGAGEQAGTGDIGGTVARVGTQMAVPKVVGKLIPTPTSLKTGAQEVLGEGPSKYTLKADLHEHALRTQAHVAQVADSVHSEAQQAMSSVASKIDAAHPEGVFPKADIRAKVGDAVGDIVKIKEQLPATLNKILSEEKPKTSTGPHVMGGHLDLSDPAQLASFEKMKAQGAFRPEEIARMQGTEQPNWTFEQLKQLRSDLGRELRGADKRGAIGAGANKAYGVLSDALRKGAGDTGKLIGDPKLEAQWLDATGKYKTYMNDFERSAVRKILSGKNASEIMRPLTGDSAVAVQKILEKYEPHGINMDALLDEARRFSGAQTVQRFSRPGRLDLIMAGISPKIAALRVGLPRMMRNPNRLSQVFGKGFEEMPEIPANKVAFNKGELKKLQNRGRP